MNLLKAFNYIREISKRLLVNKNNVETTSGLNFPNPAMFQEPLPPLDMNYLTATLEMEMKCDTNRPINENFVRDKYVMFDGEKYKLKQRSGIHREEEEVNIAIRIIGLEVEHKEFGLFLFSIQFKLDTNEIIKGQLIWDDKEYELLFSKGDLFRPRNTFLFTNEGSEYRFSLENVFK